MYKVKQNLPAVQNQYLLGTIVLLNAEFNARLCQVRIAIAIDQVFRDSHLAFFL